MITVIHSKEEERNEIGLFNWLSPTGMISDRCELNLQSADLTISTKLTSNVNQCKSYQLNITKKTEKV